jgi:uncharacterized membrane protein
VPILPVLLAAHIGLAITLLVPSIVLPFALRRTAGGGLGRWTGGLLRLQRDFSAWIGLGVAVTGVGLVLVLGTALLAEPWLAIALAIYGVDIVIAFLVQRPGLRRLVRGAASDADEAGAPWRARARTQRYVSYLMAAAIGLIAFLMMSKPEF